MSRLYGYPGLSGFDGRDTVFDSVLNQVRQCLADQFPVAVHGRRCGFDSKRQPLVFRQRFVKLLDAVGDFSDIEIHHVIASLPGFGARDHQQGIERPDQPIGFIDRPLQCGSVFGFIARFRECLLGAIAQPRQRGFQVMRDIVGHFLEAGHQRLDALQHGVEIFRQAVDLVAGCGRREPVR